MASMFMSIGYWFYDNKRKLEAEAGAPRGGAKYGSVASIPR